ncbi:hypothetical protein HAX54_046459 [Datura stramonium]|uniref:Uncharacterized protein n=1 Tax=Datura stramonium TaxID=4076 RepID=A0ABS8ST66_DATST|nr:hypothetical protein [Datura stramonium]
MMVEVTGRHSFDGPSGPLSPSEQGNMILTGSLKMSHASDAGSMEGFVDVKDEPMDQNVAGAICLSPMVENAIFHVTRH